ncbi:pentatricopeptide repeat-containing protein At4g20740 [Argentina anserina]|uniref:pentatricopeptide repeat-containing protein At4g20740 n=1 Tax=Argentina anserina TaxID=57926 RepID=UPI0021762067|nr:pentatricopeptide repeat-containing protein At4g20740 [Potentilla anserina]
MAKQATTKSVPPPKTMSAPKFSLFYGRRKPRPTVRPQPKPTPALSQPFDLSKWHPDDHSPPSSSAAASLSSLSPVARFILDAFRKNRNHWGPPVVAELRKLRRVTPDLVAEVLKAQNDAVSASKLFHWAGKQKGFKHTFASYNALAYCLNRAHRFGSADQVPDLMDSQGKPPTEKQFEILIRMHSDANRGLRVYHVYRNMKRFGVKPRVFLYNRVMDALVRAGRLDLAMSVYDDFRGDGMVEESVTYMILIKGMCKLGRVEEMLELLERMRVNLCKPDVFAYTAMIKVLVSEGRLDGCLKVWEQMRRDRVEADAMAYVTMVTGLCKGGRVDKGFELFREMKDKGLLIDRSIYGVLAEGFVEDGKVGAACDMLRDLVGSGYRADLGIYNSLIRGFCDVKRVDKAYKLFRAAVQEGLGADFATVSPILVSYAEMRKLDKFHELLAQMGKCGCPVMDDLSKFFSIVVEKEDGVMMGLEVFEHLKARSYSSAEIYNILIAGLHKFGKVKKALSLFDEMKSSDFQPDSSTYSSAIMCYIEEGDLHEACACHNKIIEMSCVPSIAAYRSLAKGLFNVGEIDAVMLLVRDCLASVTSGPMTFKYSLTVFDACRSNNAEKVLDILNEMMQQGCPPDPAIYSAIISGMCKHGTIEEARKVFLKLKERKLMTEASMIVYDDMLIEHMKKKTADLIVSGLKFFGLESKLKAKGCKLLSG